MQATSYRAEATVHDPRLANPDINGPIYEAKECTKREGQAFCQMWAQQGYFAAIYNKDGECIFEIEPAYTE